MVLVLAASLAACTGTAPTVPSPPTQTAVAAATLPDVTPGYTDYQMAHPIRPHLDCTYAGTVRLHPLTVDPKDPNGPDPRAVAVATITAIGAAHWNTADGHRPTQAEVDALARSPQKVNGLWPPDWGIFTPMTFSIDRVLAGSLGSTVTGWTVGGATAEGDLQSDGGCSWLGPFTPAVGKSVVVFLGRELTLSDPADTSLRRPKVSTMFGYHPGSDLVDLPQGSVKLSKALAG